MSHRGGATRCAREDGFTLIEILVTIVVLGVLAGIVVFALAPVGDTAGASACATDAKTVNLGVAALRGRNDPVPIATSAAWRAALLPGSAYDGAPYLQSWPSSQRYSIGVAGENAAQNSGDHLVPANGHVVVTITSSGDTYDATANPGAACSAL